MDAEFIAQTFCLEQGLQEPNTLRALERAHATGWLPDGAVLLGKIGAMVSYAFAAALLMLVSGWITVGG